MGSEANLWSTMRVQMGKNKYWLEATRHEDKIQSGIADVSFVSMNGLHSWCELKSIPAWPARESTILVIDHYTDQQRIFLKQKGKMGGCSWLFMKVGRDYLLFDWGGAQQVGKLNRDALLNTATAYWFGKMNWRELGQEFTLGGMYADS